MLTGHNSAIYALSHWNDTGKFLSAGGDGWVVEWDIENPQMGRLIAKTESQIFSLKYFPTCNLIAVGNMEGGIHWIDPLENSDMKNIAHHEQGIFAMGEIGGRIFTAGGMGRLTQWDPIRIKTKETLHLSHTSLRCMDIQGERMVIGSSDCSIYILDKEMNIIGRMENAHDNSVFALAFHPDGKHIISGGRDARLKVWTWEGKEVHSQSAHWFTINDIKFKPDSSIFATASRDKTIRIWDASDFSLLKEINSLKNEGHVNSVNRLLWLDNDHLISTGDDRTIIIWKINS